MQIGVPIGIPFVPPILVEPDEEEEEGRRRRRRYARGRSLESNALEKELRLKNARMEKLEIYKRFESTLET